MAVAREEAGGEALGVVPELRDLLCVEHRRTHEEPCASSQAEPAPPPHTPRQDGSEGGRAGLRPPLLGGCGRTEGIEREQLLLVHSPLLVLPLQTPPAVPLPPLV